MAGTAIILRTDESIELIPYKDYNTIVDVTSGGKDELQYSLFEHFGSVIFPNQVKAQLYCNDGFLYREDADFPYVNAVASEFYGDNRKNPNPYFIYGSCVMTKEVVVNGEYDSDGFSDEELTDIMAALGELLNKNKEKFAEWHQKGDKNHPAPHYEINIFPGERA